MKRPLGRLILVGMLWSGTAVASDTPVAPPDPSAARPMRAGDLAKHDEEQAADQPAQATPPDPVLPAEPAQAQPAASTDEDAPRAQDDAPDDVSPAQADTPAETPEQAAEAAETDDGPDTDAPDADTPDDAANAAPVQATVEDAAPTPADRDAEPDAGEPAEDLAVGPDPHAPAVDGVEQTDDGSETPSATTREGVWSWVARMEGEIPDPQVVDQTEELLEEARAESPLIDNLSASDVPADYYTDPAKALQGDPLYLDLVDPSEFDIPITVNDDVAKWVRYFTTDGRKYYARWLSRSTRYRPMMYQELDARGLPHDLVYLSMIESGYNAYAYSHAHAAGLWQFISSTGRVYDLRIDWWVDERRDPEKSTGAALDYLADLHKMFGSWELAWAAYNGGPGRVRRAVSSAGTSNFWQLVDGTWLQSETENYVPKIMAAAIIGKHPERYGFTDVKYQKALKYDTAVVNGMVEVSVLAKCAGMDEKSFRWLNPSLRRWSTPEGNTEIRLPAGDHDPFVAALGKVPKNERLTFLRHKVQRGETLTGIAARYGVAVSDMVRVNQLRSADRIFVGMSLIVPTGGPGAVASLERRASGSSSHSAPSRPTRHTVRPGDTLSGIAARYGVSVSHLRAWNGLRSDTILVGQSLHLTGSSSSAAHTSTVRYTIRRGDNLSAVAHRYGVRVADLQRWNGIHDPSHIQMGQVLAVHVREAGFTSYTVRPGDSLGAIGRRYGCSVDDLVAWNQLSTTVIHPGQSLKVRR